MTCARLVALLATIGALAACADADSYQARRQRFETRLLVRKPAPLTDSTFPHLSLDEWRPWTRCGLDSMAFARFTGSLDSVTVRSDEMELPAWIYTPAHPDGERLPALLYLHPGFGEMSPSIAPCASPFMAAGMVVMWPTYRGENGNPGSFEFLLGEVDDAVAAAWWLASQPQVDSTRIYAFGWSSGGGIAAMLSLMYVPLRHTGSAGGLWTPSALSLAAPELVMPFDTSAVNEWEMRTLPTNIRWMQRPHYAYIETGQNYWASSLAMVERETRDRETLLHLTLLPGDHFSVYPEAVRRYLAEIASDDRAVPTHPAYRGEVAFMPSM